MFHRPNQRAFAALSTRFAAVQRLTSFTSVYQTHIHLYTNTHSLKSIYAPCSDTELRKNIFAEHLEPLVHEHVHISSTHLRRYTLYTHHSQHIDHYTCLLSYRASKHLDVGNVNFPLVVNITILDLFNYLFKQKA